MSLQMRLSFLRLYRAWLCGKDHPAKLRMIRWIEPLVIPRQGAVFRLKNGLKMWLSPLDQLEYDLIKTGEYEPLTLRFLEQNLSVGQRILLAGVNIGLHAMVCSRVVGPKGLVIGVEPQPRSLRRTRENFLLNDLAPNLRLVSAALGKNTAIMPMEEAHPKCSGWASFRPELRNMGSVPYWIQIVTVPELLVLLGIDELDFMLLDVEGFEIPVLEGMKRGPKPKVLILEVHPLVVNKIGSSVEEYYNSMASLGYEWFDVFGKKVLPPDALPENNLIGVQRGVKPPVWIRA